ncbi:MAG: hypothetical protein MJ153_02690 [Clostridia bacterium]|nr:hypothetical protein [Clostridia bacterium]
MVEYVPHDIFGVDVRDNCLHLEVGKNDCGRMTVDFSFCGPNAIKVVSTRGKHKKRHCEYSVQTKNYSSFNIEQDDNLLTVKSGMFEILIHKKGNWQIDYRYMNRTLVTQYTDSSFTYNPNTVFYGMGNDASTLILNGTELVLSSSSSTPAVSPFFMSSDNFGIFINSIKPSALSFGTLRENTIVSDNNDEKFEFIFFVGDNTKNVLKTYLDTCSICSVAPASSFGTAIKFRDNYDITPNEILSCVDTLIQSGMNIRTIYLGYSYLPYKSKLGFVFDNTRFSDSVLFSRKLHDRGILLGVTVNPYISVTSTEFDECVENNTLVKDKNNDIVVFDVGNESFAILDFTHIAPRAYLQLKMDALLRAGADILECDFDFNYINHPDIEYNFRGNYELSDINNQFSKSINEAFYETTQRYKGIIDSFIVSSHGNIESNSIPLHNITSDMNANSINCAEYIRRNLINALQCAFCGYDGINFDIPSYAEYMSASISVGDSNSDSINESYTALAINGILMPHTRFISDYSNKDLVGADANVLNNLKIYNNLKSSLMPYLYAASGDSNLYAVPTIRPMSLEFSEDANCALIDYEYMLGSNLLIVPSMPLNNNENNGFYLPSGMWTEILSNTKIKGPGLVNYLPMGNQYSKAQVFVRSNSVVPLKNTNVSSEGSGTDRQLSHNLLTSITFMIYELQDNKVAGTEIYSSDMQSSGIINILKLGNKIKVLTRGFNETKRLMLVGIKNVVSTSDGIPTANTTGTLIEFNSDELLITLG